MATSNFQKFRLLLWKNYVLQKRHKWQTVLEILLPLVFVVVLVIVRDLVNSDIYEDGMSYPPWSPLNVSETRLELNLRTDMSVWYAPNDTATGQLMEFMQEQFLQEVPVGYGNRTFQVRGFESEDELLEAYKASTTRDLLGAVVFSKTGDEFEYSLRLPSKLEELGGIRENAQWLTALIYPMFQLLGPRSRDDIFGGPPGYHSQGFTYLQYALDVSIAYYNSTPAPVLDENEIGRIGEVYMQRFPFPRFIDDIFLIALQGWLPLIFMLSYIYPVINTTKSIVVEKEKRLKESMKMMGLPNYMHWSAWFIKSFAFLLTSTIFMVIFMKIKWKDGLAVVTYGDGGVIFLFFLAYLWSTIFMAFFISTLFSKANSGSAAAGIIWFLTYFPYFFLQPRYDTLGLGTKVFAGILSNTGMAFGCQIIAMFEGTGAGVQWSTINSGANPQDNLTILHTMLILFFDGVLYFCLAIYIEAVWPGEYGVPQPWYFPFTKTYWVGGESVSMSNGVSNGHEGNNNNPFFEPPPANAKAGIKIQGLTKRFGNKTAVKGLSLDMYENQITSLLGHNGAGKTTTMSMLTGLFPPSSGTALVNGFDIRTNIKDVRDSLGLCPQHDVLFDELTVEEHLRFFCLLKGHPDVEKEIDRMLSAVGLEPKRHSQSMTLSGGMKRKLSVGIALVGGSKVVLLDEPTSGMDPGARRATWDLLTSEKKGRTMVLSTHFMDEADLLGDRIAVMSDGELQTVGSSLFLKKKYGGGYHLVIVKEEGCDASRITRVLRSHIGDINIEQDVGAELSYSLPDDKAHLFADMFAELEERKDDLKIDSYGASLTTMEEVFIRVGRAAEERKAGKDGSLKVSIETLQDQSEKYKLYQKLDMNTGSALLLQQLRAMLVKKGLYALRNRILLTAQTIVPVAFLIIALIMIETLPGLNESPARKITLDDFDGTVTPITCQAQADGICQAYEKYINDTTGSVIAQVPDLPTWVLDESRKDISDFNYHKIIGFEKSNNILTAWFNNQPMHTPAITLNYLSNAIYRSVHDGKGQITAHNHPLPFTTVDETEQAGGFASSGFQVGFNIAFGMSFLVSSFVVFLIKERESKAKHLQYVSGASFWIFWLANFIVDFLNFLVPCVLMILVLAAFQTETLDSAKILGHVFVLMLFYGWAIIPLMYLFSFWFTIPSTGFIRMVMINVISGLAPFVAMSILSIPDLELLDTAKVLDWIFMFFPNYNIGWGINKLSTNVQLKTACANIPSLELFCGVVNPDNPCCTDYKTPDGYALFDWHTPGIGRNLTFLFFIGFASIIALMVSESKILQKLRKSKELGAANEEFAPPTDEDNDVAAEASRIRNTNLTQLFKTDNLVVRNLRKQYGTFTAVQCLNLGVQQKECFGLLGVNGAGKTTTFKMLTGDLPVSSGDAFIYGHSINSDIKQVQQNLGYCPQFDAIIEELTGRETIRLFARLRGVKEEQIDGLVDRLGANLLFSEHMEKRCGAYSGGNKRKLSTSLALVGNPPIVFLDEPTTGMDPVARRHLWNCISKVREAGTSIVLTSHSMEECEALCTRLAIMVNGQFRCLGSTQHLKSKFGEGYTVIAQISTKADVSKRSFQESLRRKNSGIKNDWETELQPLRQFIEDSFPGSILKDVHPGYVHYHVTNPSLKWSDLFKKMEVAKTSFNLEAYSVGQTTLEQVFLNFTKHQVTDE